jgi:hypothetical protein
MSGVVQFFTPQNPLKKALKTPGGVTAGEALAKARANLDTLEDACAAEVDLILERLTRTADRWPVERDDARLEALYGVTKTLIGIAANAKLPELDRAAFSLCELLDAFRTRGAWDMEAVVVHVQSLLLLRRPEQLGDKSNVAAILLGLKQVRQRLGVSATARARPKAG